jgi:hypothetical protein
VETRTNSESAHDLDFPGAAVDDVGKRDYAALLSSRPTGSFRATPPPRLLHHIPGRARVTPCCGLPENSAQLELGRVFAITDAGRTVFARLSR